MRSVDILLEWVDKKVGLNSDDDGQVVRGNSLLIRDRASGISDRLVRTWHFPR